MDQCKILSDVAKWLIKLSIHQSQSLTTNEETGMIIFFKYISGQERECFCLFRGCSVDSFVFFYISILLWSFIYGSVIIVYQWLIILPQQKDEAI